MKQYPDKVQELILRLRGRVNWRSLVITLSAIVVFVTTYLLILPAITLDKDEAIRQGGTTIAVEQTVEDSAGNIAEEMSEEAGRSEETVSKDEAGEPDKTPAEKAETPDAEPEKIRMLTGSKELTADTEASAGFTVSAVVGEANNVPADISLQASELTKETEGFDYDEHYDEALKALKKDDSNVEKIKMIRFYDISLESDTQDESVEPNDKVSVKIEYENGIKVSDADNIRIVHFGEKKTEVLDVKDNKVEATVDEKNKLTEASFETDGFSEYAVAEVETIDKYVLSSDGHNYHISVAYAPDAGIPEGADLTVEEITEGASVNGKSYEEYVAETEKTLGWENGTASFARVFDISIEKDGNKVQPADGKTVDVHIELADAGKEKELNVVHFKDGSNKCDVMESATDGKAVSFEAGSFSAYAIVQGPAAIPLGWQKFTSMEDIMDATEGVYISHVDGYYLTNQITNINSSRTGITKTKPATSYPDETKAAKYYFEVVNRDEHQVRVYCMDGEAKRYVVQSTNSLNLTTVNNASVFTMENGNSSEVFRMRGNENYYWNMQNGAKGESIAAYTGAGDANAQFNFWYFEEVENDPYNLGGKTYGLMNWAGGVAGKALMASEGEGSSLAAKALTVMSTANNSSQLFAPSDSDISMWTFHWIDQDMYYLTANADGSTKYLKISSEGLSLVSDQNEASQIKVVPGSGTHAGEICLKSGGATLSFSGTVTGGFTVNGSVGSEWLYPVELSELTSDFFMTYSAKKISVSDESVTNGSRVIVYTRSWNETKLKYDYYAISSDGTLVPVYESGDTIEWSSGQLNTLLWNFVEYYWEGTNDPNFYYELYNQYSEKFIAPQVSDGQILSADTIGINMNGRRDGKYYSSILAWDEDYYSYVGLKVEDGKIVACPKSEAMDFYFAIMQDLNIDDQLTTVPTVDNSLYGITMKMVDFGGKVIKPDGTDTSEIQQNVIGNSTFEQWTGTKNLLTTDMTDGYPTAKITDRPLSDLFGSAEDVNHLFIQSTYNETGYFSYDSTQNFASLHGNDFVVYKELGTMDNSSKDTLKHGQFMPYNDLAAGVFASVNGKNTKTISAQNLPDDDPRKYEQLYLVRNPDYHYGMELEASFTQTPSGLDAWGHDIIFEFTGDDDFWLYVDGELVIDLGGIHSALPGSVNFRTGMVIVNGKKATLREVFEGNYRTRNPEATNDEVAEYLLQYFDEGSTVFRDDTTHTMKMFYMERGAGASNLKMRFNLAAVKKGAVQLTKELAGVDSSEVEAEFPYQILYHKEDDETEYTLKNAIASSSEQNTDYVFYKDTINPVKYEKSVTIDGKTYDDVFFLKPGETADISFPEGMTDYWIVECGVNTDVYQSVSANDVSITGTEIQREDGTVISNRKDFSILPDTTDNRAKIKYTNTINPEALRTLTIKKKLYAENGITPISYSEDDTKFTFRLYLASEYDELDVANMYTYHVKNAAGQYCSWNAAGQEFVKIGDGISDYSDLSEEQKAAASFTTSIYGTIAKIPADHTVEIRGLLAGTKYRVEERPGEIPDGYSFQKYDEYEYTDSQGISHADKAERSGVPGINGTVIASYDPNVTVCNLKGWGLRVNKVWRDADYMSNREPTYFALFTGTQEAPVLVEDSVREMPYDANPQTIYWYYDHLPVSGTTGVSDYFIREVVISEETVIPVNNGETVQLNGKQKGEADPSGFTYSVTYEQGQISEDSNVRVDTVTNDRPGIILKKQDWNGRPLQGAVFTLRDSSGTLLGEFTSDEEGLITVAFLSNNKGYTLTETASPAGYHGLETIMEISTDAAGKLYVTGNDLDTEYYELTQASGTQLATLTIKNRPFTFKATKIDGDTNEPLAGVTFTLHKEKTVDGVTAFDVNPMPGYENLVTAADGSIPGIDNTLSPGNYQLREKTPKMNYEPLSGYITFTVSAGGEISLRDDQYQIPDGVVLNGEPDQSGTLEYVLTIPNSQRKRVSFLKVDISDTSKTLQGAVFDLYKESVSEGSPLLENLISGDDGVLKDHTGRTVFDLPVGTYYLVETQAPEGYYPATDPIRINVTVNDVTYDDGTALSVGGSGKSYDENTKVYTLKISNSTGYELPASGGIGTIIFYVLGSMLVLGCGIVLIACKRMSIHK